MGENKGLRSVTRPVDAGARGLRAAKPDFDGLLVVCAKCRKRQGLAKPEVGRCLKRVFKQQQYGRRLRVVEAGCLGPCPKRMLVVATPQALSRGRVLLLDPRLPADEVGPLLAQAATPRGSRTAATPGSGAPPPIAGGGDV